jgi:hypothetical protein
MFIFSPLFNEIGGAVYGLHQRPQFSFTTNGKR